MQIPIDNQSITMHNIYNYFTWAHDATRRQLPGGTSRGIIFYKTGGNLFFTKTHRKQRYTRKISHDALQIIFYGIILHIRSVNSITSRESGDDNVSFKTRTKIPSGYGFKKNFSYKTHKTINFCTIYTFFSNHSFIVKQDMAKHTESFSKW